MEEKVKTVIKALIAKTQAGEVNWRISSAEDEYCLFLDRSTITIGSIPTFNEVYYALRVYNENGDVSVEFVSDDDTNNEDSSLLRQLYEEAKASFRKEKQTLDSVMQELSKEGVVGNNNDPRDLSF